MTTTPESAPACLLLMGVSGSGKSTVGRLLAARLGGRFVDADDLHPPANIDKMARGVPLDDHDRAPWLDRVAAEISAHDGPEFLVVACSALKERHRRHLGPAGYRLVYLRGARALVERRLSGRTGHFMPADLIDSQFAALEEPAHALTVSIEDPPEVIVERIAGALAGGPA